jgi:hypothetical protein
MAESKLQRYAAQPEHMDVTYLKQDQVGGILAKGLAELYQQQPAHPIHFLGNWLLNYAATEKNKAQEVAKEERKQLLDSKYQQTLEAQAENRRRKLAEIEAKTNFEADFLDRIKQSLDVDDLLSQLAEHMQAYLKASGTYVGQLEKVKRAVTDLDDDRAHEDPEAPEVIHYVGASKNHQHMIDRVLTEEQGATTYSVFKAKEEEPAENPEEQEEGVEPPLVEEHLNVAYVEQVVGNPKMHFFDVPKLGAFLALPLVYKSCLNEVAFDAAVDDALKIKRIKAERDIERQQKVENAGSLHSGVGREEEEAEPAMVEELQPEPFKTVEVKLVVCADSLGQDRPFSEDQRDYCEWWVRSFQAHWERAEAESLQRDVTAYIEQHNFDMQLLNDKQTEWAEEERVAQEEAAKDASQPEEALRIASLKALLEVYRNRLLSGDMQRALHAFAEYKVLKFARVFQLAFYYFGIRKDRIVERGTNRIFWKQAKQLLDHSFQTYIKEVSPCGPKALEPPPYAMTTKLLADVERLNAEEVQQYSLALGLLLRFLHTCLKLRQLDVAYRRAIYFRKRDERERAIQTANELAQRKAERLREARDAHEKAQGELEEGAEKTEFDEAKFVQEFDEHESNATVEIPPEVVPDKDGDIPFEEDK